MNGPLLVRGVLLQVGAAHGLPLLALAPWVQLQRCTGA